MPSTTDLCMKTPSEKPSTSTESSFLLDKLGSVNKQQLQVGLFESVGLNFILGAYTFDPTLWDKTLQVSLLLEM